MKKYIIILALGFYGLLNAQSARGPKIGYFDMSLILQSVPEFAEANNQLELRAQTWKTEIDQKQAQINLLREELKTERILLTKELIEEKEEEIAFLEKELSDYQQKRFGPLGDLFTQKSVLVKPIQDQVFSIVNDIAARRKYDFVYDMSSASNGLVFANRRFDMNDEIINAITRASKRDQADRKRMSKEDEQAQDDKKYDPDLREKDEEIQKRKDARKELQDKKREQQKEDRQRKKDEKKQVLDAQESQENDNNEVEEDTTENNSKKTDREERDELLKQRKQKILEDRQQKQKEKQKEREEAQENKKKKQQDKQK